MKHSRRYICFLLIALATETAAIAQCEVAQIIESEFVEEDDFGREVAMDGDVAAVGATPSDLPGRVWVYRRNGFEWIEEDFLMAPTPEPSDSFGRAIDIKGDYLIIGSYRADKLASDAGAAYIYHFDHKIKSWNLSDTLLASDGELGDNFGYAVAIYDGPVRAIVGAPVDTVGGMMYAGSAYIFQFDGERWVEDAHLSEPRVSDESLFGFSCDLFDDRVLVGAHGDEKTYVFQRTNDVWSFEQQLSPQSPSFAPWFGWSVALSSSRIVIGAPLANDGFAFLFVLNPTSETWEYETTILPSNPVGVSGLFGNDVAFGSSSDTILIGASNDSEAGFEAGAAYVVQVQPDGPIESTKIIPADITVDDCFGASVASSGDLAIIGAPCQDPGGAYFFAGITPIDCNDNGASDGCDIFEGLSDDLDGDGVPDECAPGMSGDLDEDQDVDFTDLLILLDSWGKCHRDECVADLDGSGDVAFPDLIILLAQWT